MEATGASEARARSFPGGSLGAQAPSLAQSFHADPCSSTGRLWNSGSGPLPPRSSDPRGRGACHSPHLREMRGAVNSRPPHCWDRLVFPSIRELPDGWKNSDCSVEMALFRDTATSIQAGPGLRMRLSDQKPQQRQCLFSQGQYAPPLSHHSRFTGSL